MDVDLPEPSGSGVDEPVRHAGWHHHDLAGLPQSQLAVLPGTTHFVPPGFAVLDRADWLLLMIPPFLDVPMPEAE